MNSTEKTTGCSPLANSLIGGCQYGSFYEGLVDILPR
jgi:hypothetical protein